MQKRIQTSCWAGCFALILFLLAPVTHAQNYERYKPLQIQPNPDLLPELPSPEADEKQSQDDRVLVKSLDAVIIVDSDGKVDKSPEIDSLEGIHYRFDAAKSVARSQAFQSLIRQRLGQPITLRSINELTRALVKRYRDCKQPIVDILVPEQRITGGTLQIVVIESRIGRVRVRPGTYFDKSAACDWIGCTRVGRKIYEPWIENDLFWMNQNPFRRIGVDFEKGVDPGTTDVIFEIDDIRPLRAYAGIDDSGVETLNYGRFFTGFQYGNLFGRGGLLGYQFTTDEDFARLEAHSISVTQPVDRQYSWASHASWAGVTPALGLGLNQDGESWQFGSTVTRHLLRNRLCTRNFHAGYDFKSTNNNLEFAGTTISNSVADLFQLRFGFQNDHRIDADRYTLFSIDTWIGPGGGLTSDHSSAAFDTIRPGTSPDYIYGRLRYERNDLIQKDWQLLSRLRAQASSERLLFSETLGLGGFDTIRGLDQRAYNADQGWIANLEFGPRTKRWGCKDEPQSLRSYVFMDLGNGYLSNALAGEDASTFVASAGIGARYFYSDRLIARFDYGAAFEDVHDVARNDRAHFGVTWIPGQRVGR